MAWLMNRSLALLTSLALFPPETVGAQDRRDEQIYYPGGFNWKFLQRYPEAARLFNAFDYGHAILYERLLTTGPDAAPAALEQDYRFLTTDLLIRPPRFAVAEEAIEPTYAKLAWQAKLMFDWAHVLHRQIYDAYSDERLTPAERERLIERLTDYYLSRSDYAFTPVPKSMALMDDQSFSQVFRRRHAKFNGLIWAYHWLQVGLYEPLLAGRTPAEKKAGVKTTLARFWAMLEDPPRRLPAAMPMTSAIAPEFSARHPRAAVIFDNLHMMHDIISDILVVDSLTRDQKRDAIYAQLAEFRDSTRNVISLDDWRHMAHSMGGIGAMGGPAIGEAVAAAPADSGQRAHQHAGSPAPDSAAVAAVIERFHAALAAGDSAAALSLLAPDVTILESGGAETLDQYRAHHLPGDIAFARAVPRSRAPIRVTLSGDVAWATSTGVTQGEFRGRAINSESAELMVLTRSNGTWLIRAIHWSSRQRR